MQDQKAKRTRNAVESSDPIVAILLRITPDDRERVRRKAASMGLTINAWARYVFGLDQPDD